MVEALNEVKRIIDNQVKNNKILFQGEAFTGFQKTYFTTNENIKGYLNLVNIDNKNNALTVLASGDQFFNLINKGITNIDTFDINRLTEYYVFGLRMAMIEKYSYDEYLKINNLLLSEKTSFDILNDILYSLLPNMDNKYRIFWKEILDYNYSLQNQKKEKLNIIRMLFFGFSNNMKYNNYLLNEEEYNNMKFNLKRVKVNFNSVNATELHKIYNKKYDLILLSNILDYIHNHFGMNWEIKKYIKNLYKIANEDAIIFLHYLFNYYSNNYTRSYDLICGAKDEKEFLEKNPIIKIPLEKEQKIGNGIILIKK